jgi:hypothetical protein
MLTKADDHPIHQTADPVAFVGTSDRNFYDRYFFNGYSRDGETYFAAALGTYPNRGIMDAAFSIIRRGRQYSVRASRLLGFERMDTRVGPISVDVVEPLRRLRLAVGPNQYGIGAELLFTNRAGVIEEPRFHHRINGRVLLDYTRLTQHGEWSGKIAVEGEEIELKAGQWWGSRDRSWGVRPVGEREAGAPTGPLQFYWLWAPANFEDLCTHFDVNEYADGSRWHEEGMIASVGGTPQRAPHIDYKIEWAKGTRHARSAEIALRARSGEEHRIALRPLYNFYMLGIGYGHPTWAHGMYVGDDAVGGESWLLSEIDPTIPTHLHIQAVCEAQLGTRRGIGILEQLVIGPHQPSGFKEILDFA